MKKILKDPFLIIRKIFLTTLLFAPLLVWSQKMKIQKMELINDVLIVHYEIDDSNPNNEYLVSVYTSKDNYAAPVIKIKGDIGQEVKPGTRKAEWNIREEFGDYEGPLSIELRANVFIPFIRLKSFTKTKGYKRGKGYELDWRPGNTNPIHIELFKENQRLQGELNHPNNGEYTVNFASNLKPGSNYKIKVTDSKHPQDFLYTVNFRVKRKIPLLLKALPILAGGYFLATFLRGSSSSANNLPNAPAAPTN